MNKIDTLLDILGEIDHDWCIDAPQCTKWLYDEANAEIKWVDGWSGEQYTAMIDGTGITAHGHFIINADTGFGTTATYIFDEQARGSWNEEDYN